MVDQRYYEKLGGFSYVLGELRKKLGRQQTDVLLQDAVALCNELCDQYKGLPKKERVHTEQMIFPRAATFCLSNDRVYGDLCGITFQRKGTIGRGSDHCDFYFYRNP